MTAPYCSVSLSQDVHAYFTAMGAACTAIGSAEHAHQVPVQMHHHDTMTETYTFVAVDHGIRGTQLWCSACMYKYEVKRKVLL